MSLYPWWWLPSWRKLARLNAVLEQVLAAQKETQNLVLLAVNRMTDVAEGQNKVFATWVDLFKKSPGAAENRTWQRNVQQENTDYLSTRGFPTEATPVEQAKWVLEHDLG